MATVLLIFTGFIAGVGLAAVVNAVRVAHRKHLEALGRGLP
jgi:hypothetical protein